MTFEAWKDKSETFDTDQPWQDFLDSATRAANVALVRSDVIDFGLSIAWTDNEITDAINDLFSVMSPAISTYVAVAHPGLIDVINNDVTIPWLDDIFSGETMRARSVDILSE